jgi:ABC-type uncharacterized transport system ATPase subunit
MNPPPPSAALALRGVSKRFGAVLVNDDVNLAVAAGGILALVGENGAGKTTAMRIASGFYAPDRGAVEVRGEACRFAGPQDATRRGIGMVHQHFLLVEPMTVTENVVLGAEPGRRWAIDRAGAAARVAALSRDLGLEVDPAARVADLSVGERQRVELLKVLYRQAGIIILDEPTAVLTPSETSRLFAVLARLRDEGRAIVLITHKLPEALNLADEITVLRAGRVVATLPAAATNAADLARLMVGRAAPAQAAARASTMAPAPAAPDPAPEATPDPAESSARSPAAARSRRLAARGAVVLAVEGLTVRGAGGRRRLDGVSFSVHAGEILGIAAVEGNGQSELIESLAGLTDPGAAGGSVRLGGTELRGAGPRRRRALGLAHVPEDRQRRGLALDLSVAENAVLGVQDRPPFAVGPRRLWLDRAAIARRAGAIVERFAVRPARLDLPARTLSGGNQQRLVVGREIAALALPAAGSPAVPPATSPGPPRRRLLLAAQPTRGLDLAGSRLVRGELLALRDGGCAVLLVSADLDELLALADRILVLYRGRVAGELEAAAASPEDLGVLMTGGSAAAGTA